MSCHLARDAKVTYVSFASKPDLLPKFLQNSDFRSYIACFNTHEENLNLGVKGQKMVQNDKIFCLSHSVY